MTFEALTTAMNCTISKRDGFHYPAPNIVTCRPEPYSAEE